MDYQKKVESCQLIISAKRFKVICMLCDNPPSLAVVMFVQPCRRLVVRLGSKVANITSSPIRFTNATTSSCGF